MGVREGGAGASHSGDGMGVLRGGREHKREVTTVGKPSGKEGGQVPIFESKSQRFKVNK